MLFVLVSVAACGGEPLADDEHGAEACRILEESLAPGPTDATGENGLLAAGKEANQSSTPAIKAAAQPYREDLFLVDPVKLHDACVAEGVDMSDLP